MIRHILTLSAVSLLVIGCSESTKVSDDLAGSQTNSENPTGRGPLATTMVGERPVRIGEGGPRFDACQAVGKVTRSSLEVTIAPFETAKAKDQLTLGQMVYVCTRSLDQRWLGIVYEKTAAAALAEAGEDATPVGTADCGVSSPVRAKQNYEGPCMSGWVESNFIKLIAG